MENWRRGNNLQPLLVRLAEYCYKAGIPEEEVVRQTIIHYYAQAEQQTVRTMFIIFTKSLRALALKLF